MTRILAATVLTAALGFGTAAANADTINLRIGSGHPPGVVYAGLMQSYFQTELKKRVEERTDHTINFVEGYSGTIVQNLLHNDLMFSSPCETACDASDMGDETLGLGTFDGFLPIPCQSAAPSQPGEGGFDDPSAGQDPKTFGGVATPHNPDRPTASRYQGQTGFWPPITAVGRNVARFRGIPPEPLKDAHCRVAILNVGSVNA